MASAFFCFTSDRLRHTLYVKAQRRFKGGPDLEEIVNSQMQNKTNNGAAVQERGWCLDRS